MSRVQTARLVLRPSYQAKFILEHVTLHGKLVGCFLVGNPKYERR